MGNKEIYAICPVCHTSMFKGDKCSVCGYSENTDYGLYKTLALIEGEKSTVLKSAEYKKAEEEAGKKALEVKYKDEIEALKKRIEEMSRKAADEEKRKAEAEARRKAEEDKKKKIKEHTDQKKFPAGKIGILVVVILAIYFGANGAFSKLQSSTFDTSATLAQSETWTYSSNADDTTVDTGALEITAKKLKYKFRKAALTVTLKNTSDQDIKLEDCAAAVNKFMIPYIYFSGKLDTLKAGKSKKVTVDFDYEDMKPYGINSIAVIDLSFKIRNNDDYKSEAFSNGITIQTSLYDSFDPSEDSYTEAIQDADLQSKYSCTPLYFGNDIEYDHKGIQLLSEAEYSDEEGRKLFLEFKNSSDQIVYLSGSNLTINGLSFPGCGLITSPVILPGCLGLMNAYLDDYLPLETYGISEIAKVSMILDVKDTAYNPQQIVKARTIKIALSSEKLSYDSSGTELYNKYGIRIVSKGFIKDEEVKGWVAMADLLIENNSDQTITFEAFSSSPDSYYAINGEVCDKYDNFHVSSLEFSLKAGAASVARIALEDDNTLNIDSLSDVSEYDFTVEFQDSDGNVLTQPTLKLVND